MNKEDLAGFSKMLSLTAEQYGKQLSPELVRFYFEGLVHLEFAAVRAALNAHVRNPDIGHFMPKVADIIAAADGKSEDAAYRALGDLQRAFTAVGAWNSIIFTDPHINAVVMSMGGWPALCSYDADEWAKFGAREFMKRYRAQMTRPAAEAPQRLPGYFELSATDTFEKPVLFGAPQRALPDKMG